jgi:hypothetical protein
LSRSAAPSTTAATTITTAAPTLLLQFSFVVFFFLCSSQASFSGFIGFIITINTFLFYSLLPAIAPRTRSSPLLLAYYFITVLLFYSVCQLKLLVIIIV